MWCSPILASRPPRRDSKVEALRAQGALHPHPQQVRDPLFGSHEFFDPRDLVQVKYEMVRRVEVDGHSVAQTTDTFGNVIIEAQASGLPVIVSDLGGPKELVEHGVTGLITKARDLDDLERAISLLVNDEGMRKKMGQRARQSVLDRNWPGAFQAFWHTTSL